MSRHGFLPTPAAMLSLLLAVALAAPPDPATAATAPRIEYGAGAGAGAVADARADPGTPDLSTRGWAWPTTPVRVVRPFVAPPHAYGPGHRGIDVVAAQGADLRAPAGGVVAFAGSIAGRGVLTIDHGDGLVTTLEPVESTVVAGTPVSRGEVVATADLGGHAAPGTVHFGVRWNGEYINPVLLLGDVPRAVLLPCC